MPSGRAHAISISILAPFSFLVGTGLSLGDPQVGLLMSLGTACGIVIHPDLDQTGLDKSERMALKYTFGLAGEWIGIWYPYATLIPHRSFYSHFPVVSTFLRVVWLSLHIVVRIVVLQLLIGYVVQLPNIPAGFLGYWFLGLCLADILHWLLDGRPIHFSHHRGLYERL